MVVFVVVAEGGTRIGCRGTALDSVRDGVGVGDVEAGDKAVDGARANIFFCNTKYKIPCNTIPYKNEITISKLDACPT